MTDFIRRLYDANISDYHSYAPNQGCSEKAEELYMKLKNSLSGEELKLLEDFVQAENQTATEDQYFAFSKGVTIAVQLIISAFAN